MKDGFYRIENIMIKGEIADYKSSLELYVIYHVKILEVCRVSNLVIKYKVNDMAC